MLNYVIRRIIVTIPVLIGVTFIIFSLMYITPGDPARVILGDDASSAQVEELREEMGLNDSFVEQYVNYVLGLLQGDMGNSYSTGVPVMDEIQSRLPVTAKLALFSCLVAIAIGIPAGIISATRQYSILDNVITVVALIGITIPSFWLALMLVLMFAVNLSWLPASGSYHWYSYILPVISISAVSTATIARMTRSSMLEVIRQDYIRTARAKGQSEKKIIFKHALKNTLIPVITIVGIQFASGLGGAVVNEQVFSLPGVGRMMVGAIKSRDYPMVQGGVLVIAIMFCLLNLCVDLIYAYVDPRIKSQYSKSKRKKKYGKSDDGDNDKSADEAVLV